MNKRLMRFLVDDVYGRPRSVRSCSNFVLQFSQGGASPRHGVPESMSEGSERETQDVASSGVEEDGDSGSETGGQHSVSFTHCQVS
jgi:hypothetical protein